MSHRDAMPQLSWPDGTIATESVDRTSLLANLFANKMKVDDPERPALQLMQETHRNHYCISDSRAG